MILFWRKILIEDLHYFELGVPRRCKSVALLPSSEKRCLKFPSFEVLMSKPLLGSSLLLLFYWHPDSPCLCWSFILLQFFCWINVSNCFIKRKVGYFSDSYEVYSAFVVEQRSRIEMVKLYLLCGKWIPRISALFLISGNYIIPENKYQLYKCIFVVTTVNIPNIFLIKS